MGNDDAPGQVRWQCYSILTVYVPCTVYSMHTTALPRRCPEDGSKAANPSPCLGPVFCWRFQMQAREGSRGGIEVICGAQASIYVHASRTSVLVDRTQDNNTHGKLVHRRINAVRTYCVHSRRLRLHRYANERTPSRSLAAAALYNGPLAETGQLRLIRLRLFLFLCFETAIAMRHD